ncbi:hypothetical protein III_05289 [Bacillus mycoides]|uniref:Uncharacterized protein n=1 Tax=Bacillus mycoides TaxID=1405 RepID=A0ABC9QW83_BACMY|nr:hypothetical protein III_05289 [Bacillus mycoides]
MINLFYKKLRNPKLKPTHFDQNVWVSSIYNQYLQQYFNQTSIQTNS